MSKKKTPYGWNVATHVRRKLNCSRVLMQIVPSSNLGGSAAGGIYRVGDNTKSHVQINDESARRNSKERTNRLIPSQQEKAFKVSSY